MLQVVNRSAVRWRCRRGMRELDLLLEKFLASDFEALEEPQLAALARLLDAPDQDILAWLSASREPPRDLDPIVLRIRRSLNA